MIDGRKLVFEVGEIYRIPARDVFRASMRPDLSFKFELASSYLRLGYVPNGVLNLYRENIFAFNGGFEDSPRKVGVAAFERSFLSLINSLKSRGFLENEEPVYVTAELQAITGAHRVAAASALGIDIRVQVVDKSPIYDFNFFAHRTTTKNLDLAALIYVREFEDIRALIIHASVKESETDGVLRRFTPALKQIYTKSLRPNLTLYTNLKRINYLNPMEKSRSYWAGSQLNGFWGLREHAFRSMGKNSIRVVFYLPTASKETIQDIKLKVRQSLGLAGHSLHTTDTRLETFVLASAILHEESLLSMQNRGGGLWTKLDTASEVLGGAGKFDAIPDQSIVIGGSASLDAHGIRRAKDIDLVVDSEHVPDYYRRLMDSGMDVGLHLSMNEGYGASSQELANDFQKHFYFHGLKVVSLKVTRQMKQWRNLGVKDKLDTQSIVHYGKFSGSLRAKHSLRGVLSHFMFKATSAGLRNVISFGVSVFVLMIRALGAIRASFKK
jgi:hypothetical protein